MGALLVIVPLVLIAAPSHVEDGDPRHLNAAQGQEVFVVDSDRREWRSDAAMVMSRLELRTKNEERRTQNA